MISFPFLSYFFVPSFEMFAESDCLGMDPLEKCILKHPSRSWHLICSPCPDDDKLFIARAPRASCDPNPPTYCSNRVPRQTKSCFILFINREEEEGVGARTGRVVASKCDPYYVWGALVPVRLARISTIQECMQTLGEMWTPGTW